MYPCTNCGRVLTSQQNLNYHLSHKPKTCEKYLRKLANQQKRTEMATSVQTLCPLQGNDVCVPTSSSPKSSSQVAAVSPSMATKFVENDVSVSTSSLPKPSSQVARTIGLATQPTAALLSSAAKSVCVNVTCPASPVRTPGRTVASNTAVISSPLEKCPTPAPGSRCVPS